MNNKKGNNSKIFLVAILALITILAIFLISQLFFQSQDKKKDVSGIKLSHEQTSPNGLNDKFSNDAEEIQVKSDSITGLITNLGNSSLTIKDEEREVTIKLPAHPTVYSIDEKAGLVTRDFSEIKIGATITVEYDLATNTAKYVVIE